MKITANTSTETVIKVRGVPTTWEALVIIQKEIGKIDKKAKVDYLQKGEGYQITAPGDLVKWKNPPLNMTQVITTIVENAVAEATKKLAQDKADNIKWVEDFKFRDVGALKARGKYQEALQKIIAMLEDSAKHAKETMPHDDAYYSMFDMTAYYEVWDAVRKHGWKKAAEVALHQDTAVREQFCEYFDMLDEEGKEYE